MDDPRQVDREDPVDRLLTSAERAIREARVLLEAAKQKPEVRHG